MHTPIRIIILFVVAISTLISSVIDALLKKSEGSPSLTMQKAVEANQHMMFESHRNSDDVTIA